MQKEKKRLSPYPMQRERPQTLTSFWALSLSASLLLCCCLVPSLAGADPDGKIVVAAREKTDGHRRRGRAKPTPVAQDEDTPKTDDSDKKNEDIDIDQARRLFEEHQRNLERIQKEQESLQSETQSLTAERADLESKLIEAGRQAQESEKRLTEIEGQLEKLGAQEAEIRVALTASRATIAEMLGVMQRMGREPPPIMVTSRADALKMVRSAMVLSSFFPKFKDEAERLSSRLTDLDKVVTEARDQRDRLSAEKEEFEQSAPANHHTAGTKA